MIEWRNIDAVVFDMDGLLLDTERIALTAFRHACDAFGLGELSEVFMQCVGTTQASGQAVLRCGLAGKADPVAFGHTWDEKYRELISAAPLPLKPGARALLERLATLRVPAAVATSTATRRARDKLASAGILDFFDEVIGGDQVEHSKPHPAIYLKAAESLGMRPRRCLALEDSENGVRAAVAAGMIVAQVPDLVPPSIELLALGHLQFATLDDVLATF